MVCSEVAHFSSSILIEHHLPMVKLTLPNKKGNGQERRIRRLHIHIYRRPAPISLLLSMHAPPLSQRLIILIRANAARIVRVLIIVTWLRIEYVLRVTAPPPSPISMPDIELDIARRRDRCRVVGPVGDRLDHCAICVID